MKNDIKLLQLLLLFTLFIFCTTPLQAQPSGCTDSLATNFDPSATINDGSCLYDSASVSPIQSWTLPQTLNETSGLIIWENKFWTHNDDTDTNLYAFDTADITHYSEYPLALAVNNDWEEITQDDDFIYIGDFGNNGTGNRTDLKILRVDKTSLLQNSPLIDTINFSYALQNDFSQTGSNSTDFDCEAFIIAGDSIYLFTKEWASMKSSVYSLPGKPGNYTAKFISQYNVGGLITGATHYEDKKIVALTGYSPFLQPFILLLYDYHNRDFFSGNKRKILLNLPFHQVEGIATADGLTWFITNERFTQSIVTTAAKVHRLDLSGYLSHYLRSVSTAFNPANTTEEYFPYPNPANTFVNFKLPDSDDFRVTVYNALGQKVGNHESKTGEFKLNVSRYNRGLYYYVINKKYSYPLNGKFMVE